MQSKYFEFLLSIIGDSNAKLCADLFSMEFVWDPRIALDADRAENGKSLRLLYFQETGESSGMEGMPCTILEMMIALSLAMENIMGVPGDDHPGRWFWDMIDNLGLDGFYNEQMVIDRVGMWLSRNYQRNGKGGIFPLKNSNKDQRKVPIWEQAGEYMSERV